jgi:chromosome segregation ATPase
VSAKGFEEIRSIIGDLLDGSLSDVHGALELLRLADDASVHLLLTATLSVARERRNERVDELEHELREIIANRDWLEDQLQELRCELEGLRDELAVAEGAA